MPTRTKFRLFDINHSKLAEELRAAVPILVSGSIGVAGFTRISDRRYKINAERKEVGRSVHGDGGVRIERIDEADPGELRFTTPRELTFAENADLDTALAAHDPTQLTLEQQRRDKDEEAIVEISDTTKDREAWDRLNLQAQVDILRRWVQLLARGAGDFGDFDTDD